MGLGCMKITISRYDTFRAFLQRLQYDHSSYTAVFYFDEGNSIVRQCYALCRGEVTLFGDFGTNQTVSLSEFMADFPTAIATQGGITLS